MRYVQLAKARPFLELNPSRTTDLTIAGALRLLATVRNRSPLKKPKVTAGLSSLDWDAADLEQRQNFLRSIGLLPFFAAMPPDWRGEIERRVGGQRAAAAASKTEPSVKIAKTFRLALSTKNPEEFIAALNAIRRLLERKGYDLHDLAIAVETVAIKRAA